MSTSIFSWADLLLLVSLQFTNFPHQHIGRRAVMWPNVRRELRVIRGLFFLVEHNLSAVRLSVVQLGDSSTYGFSLMSTVATHEEIGRSSWRALP